VVEAAGAPASLLAMSGAGPIALALAAERPDLVSRLVLHGTYADGPAVFTNPELGRALVAMVRTHWGMGSTLIADLYRPGSSGEAARHLARVLRDSADREVAAGYLEAIYQANVAALLPRVRARAGAPLPRRPGDPVRGRRAARGGAARRHLPAAGRRLPHARRARP